MSTIVVQAHPLVDSYNGALLERVRGGLTAAGADHVVFRLGQGEHPGSEDLARARTLVLVYPTWWSGQPAMLLAWLQRMLAADALGTIEHIQVVTSLGSSRFLNRIQGEWGRRFLAEHVLEACASDATLGWHAFYKIDRRSTHDIATFLSATERLFSSTSLPAG